MALTDLALPSPDRPPPLNGGGFGRVFDVCAEAMLAVDPWAGRILDANPAAGRLLGYDRAVLRGMAMSDLHPGQLPALIVFTDAVLSRRSFRTRTLMPRHATGAERSEEHTSELQSLMRISYAVFCL